MADTAGRNTRHDRQRLDVAGHHCAGTHHRAVAIRDTHADDRPRTDEDMVADAWSAHDRRPRSRVRTRIVDG